MHVRHVLHTGPEGQLTSLSGGLKCSVKEAEDRSDEGEVDRTEEQRWGRWELEVVVHMEVVHVDGEGFGDLHPNSPSFVLRCIASARSRSRLSASAARRLRRKRAAERAQREATPS